MTVPTPRAIDEETCCLLFTDVEGSTALWDERPNEMALAMDLHDSELSKVIVASGGRVLSHTGDGYCTLFTDIAVAVEASLSIQSTLMRLRAELPVSLQARVGIHTGSVIWRGDEPRGQALNEANRVMSAGHGGQVLLSGAASIQTVGRLPEGASLAELGAFRLKGLAEPMRLVQLCHPALPRRFPPLRAIPMSDPFARVHGTFIGREAELSDLALMVNAGAATVLVGPAGVGKTRLALRAGQMLSASFADGAVLVELATVLDPRAVEPACAAALGAHASQGDGGVAGVMESIRHRHQLLIIDNCEHVIAEVRRIVREILSQCRGLAVLATSREPLLLGGEATYRVLPLTCAATVLDGRVDPAVQLFLDRALVIQPNFILDDDAVNLVHQIVRRLDGLPLAIELAASQLRRYTLVELARIVTAGALIDSGDDAPLYAHGTLERAIAWSYSRLSPGAARLFDACSVFAGPFSVDAATAVGPEPPQPPTDGLLDEITRSSLAEEVNRPSQRAFQLLDSMRDFAGRNLVKNEGVAECRARLVRYYAAFATEAGQRVQGADEREWVRRVNDEFANIRQAQQFAIGAEDVDAAMSLMAGLHDWSLWRMRYELTSWALAAIELPDARSHPLFPQVSASAVYGLWASGDFSGAHKLAATALKVEAQQSSPPCVLLRDAVASLLLYERRFDEAWRWTDECLNAAARSGNSFRLARALYNATLIRMAGGDIRAASTIGRQAMEAARETGSPTALAFAHHAQGLLARRSDRSWAARCFEEAASKASLVGNELAAGLAHTELARLDELDSPVRALRALRGTLQHWTRAADHANQSIAVQRTAKLLADLGQDDEAIALLVANPWGIGTGEAGQSHASPLAKLRERVAPSRVAAAESIGELLLGDALVQYALDAIDRALAGLDSSATIGPSLVEDPL